MILQFCMENFRSIKDEICLDFVSNGANDITQFPGYFTLGKKEKVSKAVCIIGNNASGKTNVLKGLESLALTVLRTTNIVESQKLSWIVPYRFDKEASSSPTSFKLLFLLDGVRYWYEISLTQDEVFKESLSFAPKGRMVPLFRRERGEEIQFHPHLVSGDNVKLISERNLKNKPVVTFAMQFNIPYLKDVYRFFDEKIAFLNGFGYANEQGIGRLLESNPKYHAFLRSLLKAADLNIDDIGFSKTKGNMAAINGGSENQLTFSIRDQDIYHVFSNHRINGTDYPLSIGEESVGTQKIMALSGSLFDALQKGKVLVYDELGSSLHPLLSAFILSLFFDDSINTKHAQLFFNTQETSLLNEQLLRRDEIYLTEKDKKNGSTIISCLKDYGVRKQENIENGYRIGRYSSTPALDSGIIEL